MTILWIIIINNHICYIRGYIGVTILCYLWDGVDGCGELVGKTGHSETLFISIIN